MKGLIYKITSGDKIYIGSTQRTLQLRINSGHHGAFVNYGLDYNDCEIEILDTMDYQDKNELYKLEGEYICKYNSVNQKIPKGFGKDKKGYDKQRYETKKEEFIRRQRERHNANKEEINMKRREKYQANKEEINRKRREKYNKK